MRHVHKALSAAGLLVLVFSLGASVDFFGRRLFNADCHQSFPEIQNHALIDSLPVLAMWTDPELQDLLQFTLNQAENSAVARVAVITRMPTPGDTISLYRFSIVAARAQAWFPLGAGPPLHGSPLSKWGPYLNDLSAGRCSHQFVRNLTAASIEHFDALGIKEFDVCPIIIRQQLVGALYVSWGGNRHTADPERFFPEILESARGIGRMFLQDQKT